LGIVGNRVELFRIVFLNGRKCLGKNACHKQSK